jgi:hypothetical protein
MSKGQPSQRTDCFQGESGEETPGGEEATGADTKKVVTIPWAAGRVVGQGCSRNGA